jgi:CRISPR-associated protein Cmr6
MTNQVDIRRVQNIMFDSKPNAGLIYDKYMKSFGPNDKSDIINQTKKASLASPMYRAYFQRWYDTFQHANIAMRSYKTEGRLIIGIGDASVRDIGISLNHTYGVPYIPGSSLKGIVSSYILGLNDSNWDDSSDNYQNLFGTQALAGGVSFMDALWNPTDLTDDESPLEVDVINPHHQLYYNPLSNASPDDFEGPIPNQFLTVKNQQHFVVPIYGDVAWVDIAFSMLTQALFSKGIGAKTNAGYGRMVIADNVGNTEQTVIAEFQNRLNSIPGPKIKSEIGTIVLNWRQTECSDHSKRVIAKLILAKADEAKVDENKSWYLELKSFVNLTQ